MGIGEINGRDRARRRLFQEHSGGQSETTEAAAASVAYPCQRRKVGVSDHQQAYAAAPPQRARPSGLRVGAVGCQTSSRTACYDAAVATARGASPIPRSVAAVASETAR